MKFGNWRTLLRDSDLGTFGYQGHTILACDDRLVIFWFNFTWWLMALFWFIHKLLQHVIINLSFPNFLKYRSRRHYHRRLLVNVQTLIGQDLQVLINLFWLSLRTRMKYGICLRVYSFIIWELKHFICIISWLNLIISNSKYFHHFLLSVNQFQKILINVLIFNISAAIFSNVYIVDNLSMLFRWCNYNYENAIIAEIIIVLWK